MTIKMGLTINFYILNEMLNVEDDNKITLLGQ